VFDFSVLILILGVLFGLLADLLGILIILGLYSLVNDVYDFILPAVSMVDADNKLISPAWHFCKSKLEFKFRLLSVIDDIDYSQTGVFYEDFNFKFN